MSTDTREVVELCERLSPRWWGRREEGSEVARFLLGRDEAAAGECVRHARTCRAGPVLKSLKRRPAERRGLPPHRVQGEAQQGEQAPGLMWHDREVPSGA